MSVSLLLSNVSVTGSNVIYNPNLTGIGGVNVIQSGSTVLFSGHSGDVTQAQLTSASGALQTQISLDLTQAQVLSRVYCHA